LLVFFLILIVLPLFLRLALFYCLLFLPSTSADHSHLHSFPTRRSSDLPHERHLVRLLQHTPEVRSPWPTPTWKGSSHPSPRRSPSTTSPSPDGSRAACRAATCASARAPSWSRTPPPTAGSSVTAWCTGSGSATAAPSGTATAGSARGRWRSGSARNGPPGPWSRTSTSPPTPTCSSTPGTPSRSSRPAPGRTGSTTS